MLIVDAQVHIWANNKPTNPGHRQIDTFSKDDLLKEMDEAGVDAAVIHPPGWDPNSNELAIEAARQHPDRLSILGNFPLDRPESRALIAGWKSQPGMLGLRFTFNQPHQRTWPTDGTIDWVWPAAEQAWHTHRAGRGQFPTGCWAGCRTPSGAPTDYRSPRENRRHEGRGGLRESVGTPGAGPVSQRGDQGHRGAELLQRTLSLSQHSALSAPDSTTLSVPSACSGGRTSRACRAPGSSA